MTGRLTEEERARDEELLLDFIVHLVKYFLLFFLVKWSMPGDERSVSLQVALPVDLGACYTVEQCEIDAIAAGPSDSRSSARRSPLRAIRCASSPRYALGPLGWPQLAYCLQQGSQQWQPCSQPGTTHPSAQLSSISQSARIQCTRVDR